MALCPTTVDELQDAIRDAAASGAALEIRGGGSKRDVGAPSNAEVLDLRGFDGVVDYDPSELVLTVRAGTPLTVVERLLDAEHQRLAFEPFDWAPIFGAEPGSATIGGTVAAAVAGSRRLSAGMTRDHVLGLVGVSGRGERFVAGGRVVKNVTGFDLPKLLTGSWGRLAAITEVTLRTVPTPRLGVTRVLDGLPPRRALAAMTSVQRSRVGASAIVHDPGTGRPARTGFRIEGFEPSVEARCRLLDALLAESGIVRTVAPDEDARFWRDIATATTLADAPALWRVVVAPSRACDVIEAVAPSGTRWTMDWGGGLLLLGSPAEAAGAVREAAERAGGHATLLRADPHLRQRIPLHQPRSPAIMALEARLRRGFDPRGVFETGRFLDEVHAH